MKRLIIMATLLIVSSTAFAQSKFMQYPLNKAKSANNTKVNPVGGTRAETATNPSSQQTALPVVIGLKDAAKADAVANSDPSSYEVGEIPYQSDVVNGALTYTVPIQVVQAGKGLQPSIFLSYNSMYGNGVAGYGWDTNGASVITPIHSDYYFDGLGAAPAKVDKNGAFALDGMRLIKTSEDSNHIYYESETGNVKVINYAPSGKYYFEVFYPEGKTGIFGIPTHTSSQFLYPLTKLTDKFSNYIEYSYISVVNEKNRFLSEVKYGSQSTLLGRITLEYTSRTDYHTAYLAGNALRVNRLLTGIKSYYGQSLLLAEYNMEYTFNKVHLLTAIHASYQGKKLRPLVFEYGTGDTTPGTLEKTYHAGLSTYFRTNGETDIIFEKIKFDPLSSSEGLIAYPYFSPFGPDLWMDGWFYTSTYHSQQEILIYKDLTLGNPQSILAGAGFQKMVAADIDGTGKEKLIKVNYHSHTSVPTAILTIYNEKMESSTKTYTFSETFYDGDILNPLPRTFLFGDFTGAGKTQMLTFHSHTKPAGEGTENYSTTSTVALFNLDQSGTGKVLETTIPGIDMFKDLTFAADMNGNGRAELCVIKNNVTYIYALIGNGFQQMSASQYGLNTQMLEDRKIVFGDINQDGAMDILLSPVKDSAAPYKWTRYSSTGGALIAETIELPIGYKEDDEFLLYDVNGDKYPDLVVNSSNQTTVYLNENDNFTNRIGNYISAESGCYLIPGDIRQNSLYKPGEVLAITNSVVTSLSFSRNEAQERLMTASTDSYGIRSQYTYRTFAGSRIPGSLQVSYPYMKFIVNAPVVYQVMTYLGNEKITDIEYKYYDAIINRMRGNFVGFEQTSIEDLIREHKITNYYDPTKLGALVKTVTPTHTTESTYNLSVAANKKAQLTVTRRVDTDLQTGHSISTAYQYDEYGNMTREVMTPSDTPKKTTTRAYYNNTATSNYIIGVLTSQTVVMESGNKSSVLETDIYTLNSQNLPVKHEKWFEDISVAAGAGDHSAGYNPGYTISNEYLRKGRAILEENEYDQWGNLTKHTTRPFNADTALTTSYYYDTFGRITRVNSPIPGIYTTTRYSIRGEISETADHKNNKTTYEYDVFGNVAKTTYPDGTVETRSLSWSTASEPGLYCITTTATGQPTVKTWMDTLGREVRTGTERFNGEWVKTDKEYNIKGLLVRESLPYTGSSAQKWNQYEYDGYGRPIEVRHASGSRETHLYEGATVTSVKEKVRVSVTYNSKEDPISVTDTTGTIVYNYLINGQIGEIITSGGVKTTFGYDLFGRQTSLQDPSAGTITYRYDSAGNISGEVAASGKTTRYRYDRYNRLIRTDIDELPSIYYRYNEDNRLVEERSTNQVTSYTYDTYGRVTEQKDEITGERWLRRNHTYTNGILTSTTYTSRNGRVTTENYIYNKGYLTEILLDNKTSVWKLVAENELGIPVEVTTGPLARTYGYNEYGTPTGRTVKKGSTAIQDFFYSFDPETHNLLYRTDKLHNKTEHFVYDELNRLIRFGDKTIRYDNQGNILFNPTVGNYSYEGNSPYGVKTIRNEQYEIPANTQRITYNAMKQPSAIAENNFSATFAYGNDNQRIKMVLAEGNTQYLTRYYLFNYEVEETETGVTERLYIGGDAYVAPVVLIKAKGQTEINYICRDHLGSITHLTDATGTVKQELSYDAWGRLRSASTHELYTAGGEPTLLLGRGYTGHEHLQPFGLINMNARLYDPVLARFLSPDPYVQSPLFSQAFNRYSYAMNNPLKFTDPDGEFAFLIPLAYFAVSYITYGAGTGNWGLKAVYAGLIGAAAGTLSAAVGGLASNINNVFSSFTQLTTIQALQFIRDMYISTLLNYVLSPASMEIGKFTLSISPIAMLTSSAMGGGFRFGAGAKVSYNTGHWTFSVGLQMSSNEGGFGVATGSAGVFYTNSDNTYGYTHAQYWGEYTQRTGILSYRGKYWSVSFENDVIGDLNDRWRSNAVEVGYRDYLLGTNVFTNQVKGFKDSTLNSGIDEDATGSIYGKHTTWKDGKVFSSPLYIGIKNNKGQVARIGADLPIFADIFQNGIHAIYNGNFFYRGKFSGIYLQAGLYQSHTLF